MHHKKILVSLVLIAIIAGTVFYFYKDSIINNKANKNKASTSSTINLPLKTGSNTVVSLPNSNSSTTNNTSTGSSVSLSTPTGNFVSNHNPNVNNPRQLIEVSVCYTNSGAYCVIQFTNSNKTISLNKQEVGSNGYVSWSWNISNLGFYQGEWTITAIATLSGQVKTATDSMPLSIQ